MAENTPTRPPSQEELLFNQAVEAIEAEDYAQARELLTRLLQGNQGNPQYWVWMSAAADTQKERVYCLQTALKLDPENASARRGLAILNAVENVDPLPPFPVHLPRPWETRLNASLQEAKPKLPPATLLRLATAAGVILLATAGLFFGIKFISKEKASTQQAFSTARPTVTPYKTNTEIEKTARPKPLAELLTTPYTPTPIYAATPHGDLAADSYRAAMYAYESGQWENAAIMMAQVATAQPGSADALYFIAETLRFNNHDEEAGRYYNLAMTVNPNYAPPYLGQARMGRDIVANLNKAIRLDPNYAEAHLERGIYYLNKKDWLAARADLEKSISLQPSALAELNLARVLLALQENEAAVETAQKANNMDVTMLEGYLVLGMAYHANNQASLSVEALETYLKYQPDSAEAFAVLGEAYLKRGDYTLAEKNLLHALSLNAANPEPYAWLGQTYLALKEYDNALEYFSKARTLNPDSFDASEGLAKTYIAREEFNNAYIAIIKVEKSIQTPQERARFLYIRALSLEKLDQPGAALRDWKELLALPQEASPAEMRAIASQRITTAQSPTPTATLKPGGTRPTTTPRPTDTRVPTGTPKISATPTP